MATHEQHAEEYRLKAEELRATIPDSKDRYTREMIEKMAAGYDQLVRVQDNLANVDKTTRRP